MRQLTQLARDLRRQRADLCRSVAPSEPIARASPGPAAARLAWSLDHAHALSTRTPYADQRPTGSSRASGHPPLGPIAPLPAVAALINAGTSAANDMHSRAALQ